MMLLLLQKDGALLTQLPVTTNLDSEQIIPPSSPTTPHQATVQEATYTVTVTTTIGTQLQQDMVLIANLVAMYQAISALQAGIYLQAKMLQVTLAC